MYTSPPFPPAPSTPAFDNCLSIEQQIRYLFEQVQELAQSQGLDLLETVSANSSRGVQSSGIYSFTHGITDPLTEDILANKAVIDELNTETTANIQDIQNLQKSQQASDNSIRTLSQDLTGAEADIAALRKADQEQAEVTAALQATASAQQQAVQANTAAIDEMQKEVMANSGDIAAMGADIAALTKADEGQDANITSLETRLAANETAASAAAKEAADAKAEASHNATDISKLQITDTAQAAEISNLKTQAAENHAAISEATATANNAAADIALLKTSQAAQDREISDLQTTASAQAQDIATLTKADEDQDKVTAAIEKRVAAIEAKPDPEFPVADTVTIDGADPVKSSGVYAYGQEILSEANEGINRAEESVIGLGDRVQACEESVEGVDAKVADVQTALGSKLSSDDVTRSVEKGNNSPVASGGVYNWADKLADYGYSNTIGYFQAFTRYGDTRLLYAEVVKNTISLSADVMKDSTERSRHIKLKSHYSLGSITPQASGDILGKLGFLLPCRLNYSASYEGALYRLINIVGFVPFSFDTVTGSDGTVNYYMSEFVIPEYMIPEGAETDTLGIPTDEFLEVPGTLSLYPLF